MRVSAGIYRLTSGARRATDRRDSTGARLVIDVDIYIYIYIYIELNLFFIDIL